MVSGEKNLMGVDLQTDCFRGKLKRLCSEKEYVKFMLNRYLFHNKKLTKVRGGGSRVSG